MGLSYAEVDQLGRDLLKAQAAFGVAAISDSDYSEAMQRASREGRPLLSREQVHADITRALNAVLLAWGVPFPDDQDVAYAQTILRNTLAMRERLLSLVPQPVAEVVAANVDKVTEQVNAMTRIPDPEQVGWDTFKEGVASQAKDIALFLPRTAGSALGAVKDFVKGAYDKITGAVEGIFGAVKTGGIIAMVIAAVIGLVLLGLTIYIIVMIFRSGAATAFAAGAGKGVGVAAVA